MQEEKEAEELTWGASAFCAVRRRKLREKRLRPPIPIHHINFLCLGPAGVGKSSLIHTSWRALSGSLRSDAGLLERLRLDFETDDTSIGKSGGLRARHGTTELTSYALQTASSSSASTSIFVQDTKGQQFFDDVEMSFAEKLVHGHMRSGSTAERQAIYFWAMVARIGLGRLVKKAKITHSPHAIVFVFDLTLRSFQRAVQQKQDSALLNCYRQVAATAKQLGLPVFAVLTHVDVYEQTALAGRHQIHKEEERRVGEAVAEDIKAFRRDLAAAVGHDLLPVDRIFPIANYHATANDRNAALELAALDFLSAVVDAAEIHLLQQLSSSSQLLSSSTTQSSSSGTTASTAATSTKAQHEASSQQRCSVS